MTPARHIIRIKQGYNPNSSSIGTQVSSFLWAAGAFAFLANAVLAVVAAVRRGRNTEGRGSAADTAGDHHVSSAETAPRSHA